MSVLAIKNQLSNVILPAITIPPQVTFWTSIISPRQSPKLQKLGTRVVVLLGTYKLISTRKTMPRGFGNRENVYEIPLHVTATHQDAIKGGDQMDVIVNAIIEALQSAQTQIGISDPITGENSWLLAIGEKFTVEELPVHGVEDNIAGLIAFGRTIRCTISEWVQA